MPDRETVIWCARCREDKGEVLRIPTGNSGVFEHKTNPDPLPRTCDCGASLERKP